MPDGPRSDPPSSEPAPSSPDPQGAGGGPSGTPPPTSGLEWRRGRFIPESELRFEQDIGGGPGGQHVNKTATRVTLIWRPLESIAFGPRERERLREGLASRLTRQGEIRLRSSSERSVQRNREECLALLAQLVRQALAPRRKRVPTRPTRASKQRRLDTKRARGRKKEGRKKPRRDED